MNILHLEINCLLKSLKKLYNYFYTRNHDQTVKIIASWIFSNPGGISQEPYTQVNRFLCKFKNDYRWAPIFRNVIWYLNHILSDSVIKVVGFFKRSNSCSLNFFSHFHNFHLWKKNNVSATMYGFKCFFSVIYAESMKVFFWHRCLFTPFWWNLSCKSNKHLLNYLHVVHIIKFVLHAQRKSKKTRK